MPSPCKVDIIRNKNIPPSTLSGSRYSIRCHCDLKVSHNVLRTNVCAVSDIWNVGVQHVEHDWCGAHCIGIMVHHRDCHWKLHPCQCLRCWHQCGLLVIEERACCYHRHGSLSKWTIWSRLHCQNIVPVSFCQDDTHATFLQAMKKPMTTLTNLYHIFLADVTQLLKFSKWIGGNTNGVFCFAKKVHSLSALKVKQWPQVTQVDDKAHNHPFMWFSVLNDCTKCEGKPVI